MPKPKQLKCKTVEILLHSQQTINNKQKTNCGGDFQPDPFPLKAKTPTKPTQQ